MKRMTNLKKEKKTKARLAMLELWRKRGMVGDVQEKTKGRRLAEN